jgi:hypothetical protein
MAGQMSESQNESVWRKEKKKEMEIGEGTPLPFPNGLN